MCNMIYKCKVPFFVYLQIIIPTRTARTAPTATPTKICIAADGPEGLGRSVVKEIAITSMDTLITNMAAID